MPKKPVVDEDKLDKALAKLRAQHPYFKREKVFRGTTRLLKAINGLKKKGWGRFQAKYTKQRAKWLRVPETWESVDRFANKYTVGGDYQRYISERIANVSCKEVSLGQLSCAPRRWGLELRPQLARQ